MKNTMLASSADAAQAELKAFRSRCRDQEEQIEVLVTEVAALREQLQSVPPLTFSSEEVNGLKEKIVKADGANKIAEDKLKAVESERDELALSLAKLQAISCI